MTKKDLEDAKSLVRVVLPLMARHGVPITPQNYAVWYAYAAGNNNELQKTLNELIDSGAPFSDEQNERLYTKFGFIQETHEIKKLRDELLQVLLTILNDISEMNGENEHYESFLSDSVGRLSQEVSLEDIKTIIERIILETRAIVNFGKTARKKINHITGELMALQKNLEQTRTEALRDFLTGINNRKAFDEMLERLTNEADSSPKGLCLLLIDIDHFKRFNDEHGHMVGDEVLRFTAQKIKSQIRGGDFVARIGGEEFGVLLPDTALSGAEAVAENIRAFFSGANLKTAGSDKKLGRITLSIGATRYRPGETEEAFFQRADKALYAAKAAGRDRLILASDRVSTGQNVH